MNRKKSLLIILSLFIICLFISSTNAVDDNNTQTLNHIDENEIPTVEESSAGLADLKELSNETADSDVKLKDANTTQSVNQASETPLKDVKLTLKEIYTVKGDYAVIKTKVSSSNGGKVKFTVNGKNYYKGVDKNGYSTLKVKMNKKGTFTYSATYTGDETHKASIIKKSKVHVLGTSKKARTVSLKGYKIIIPLKKYKNLINAKNTEKTYVYLFKLKKTIKQKVDVFNEKTFKKTTKTVKSRIYIYVCFDGNHEYTGSLPPGEYVAEITTSNQHRTGPVQCQKWLFGYKQSKNFEKLNSAKVRQKLARL